MPFVNPEFLLDPLKIHFVIVCPNESLIEPVTCPVPENTVEPENVATLDVAVRVFNIKAVVVPTFTDVSFIVDIALTVPLFVEVPLKIKLPVIAPLFVILPRTIVGTLVVNIVPLFTTLPVKFPPDRLLPARIVALLKLLRESIIQLLATSIALLIVEEETLTVPVVEATPEIVIFAIEILFVPAYTFPVKVEPGVDVEYDPRIPVLAEIVQFAVVLPNR